MSSFNGSASPGISSTIRARRGVAAGPSVGINCLITPGRLITARSGGSGRNTSYTPPMAGLQHFNSGSPLVLGGPVFRQPWPSNTGSIQFMLTDSLLLPYDGQFNQYDISTANNHPQALASHQSTQLDSAQEHLQTMAPRALNPLIPEFEPKNFVPTLTAHLGRGVWRPLSAPEHLLRMYTGTAWNDRGHPSNPYGHRFQWLRDDQNCSYWIKLLPANVTEHELLREIRNCGPILCVRIHNGEVGIRTTHAAAKLIFLTEEGAANFDTLYMANQSLAIRGRKVRVTKNRNKFPEQRGWGPDVSRCVRLRGPPYIVDVWFLLYCFDQCFEYQIDEIITHSSSTFLRDIEIRFASFRAQAQFAVEVLTTARPFVDTPNLVVEWELDPCAPLPPNHQQWPRPVVRG